MFGVQLVQGATRNVFIVWRWAFKVPRLKTWRMFLHGLLANMQERLFSGCEDFPGLCPVLWGLPGGFLICMRRAEPLPLAQWNQVWAHQWLAARRLNDLCEGKENCFGLLEGRVVVVDYGCGG